MQLNVDTDSHDPAETHDVFFNRGAIASQAYATRFGNRDPDEAGPSLRAFTRPPRSPACVHRAGKKQYVALRAAIYEFQYPDVLDAFHTADAAGADVQIVYTQRNAKGPKKKNEAAIKAELINLFARPERPTRATSPTTVHRAVEGRGARRSLDRLHQRHDQRHLRHLNVGHVIRDKAIAARYLQYWTDLSEDPDAKTIKPKNVGKSCSHQRCGQRHRSGLQPQTGSDALDWYVDLMANAKAAAFLTGAFGVPAPFVDLLKTVERRRFILLEKPGQGANAGDVLDEIKAVRSNQIVVGPPKWFSLTLSRVAAGKEKPLQRERRVHSYQIHAR